MIYQKWNANVSKENDNIIKKDNSIHSEWNEISEQKIFNEMMNKWLAGMARFYVSIGGYMQVPLALQKKNLIECRATNHRSARSFRL